MGNLVPTETVKIGDSLTLANGKNSAVIAVKSAANNGLYNPQTSHGDIIVNGVVASTYTIFIKSAAAHTFLALIRALYRTGASQSLNAFSNLFGTVSA